MASFGGPIAQRLEQGTHNPLVAGSNPAGPKRLTKDIPTRDTYNKPGRTLTSTTRIGSSRGCGGLSSPLLGCRTKPPKNLTESASRRLRNYWWYADAFGKGS